MNQSATQLRPGSVGVWHIVFFVIATAGPLVSLIGAAPAGVALGNGAGLPGTYVLVALLYLLFSVAFTAMSRHIANAGAFFAYISEGLGARSGAAGAVVAIMAYGALQIGTYALFGIFCLNALAPLGWQGATWWWYALAAAIAVHLIGRRTVAFSGRVLGALLICEIVLVLALDGAILSSGTPLRMANFAPGRVLGSGFGASLAFVVPCFLGFEATAIFGEEAHDPTRTIPRATYAAVGTIGAIYALSSWAILSCYPIDEVRAIAATHGETFVFDVARRQLGPFMVVLTNAMMITSMFAALLSLHNVLARYLYALARAGLAPHMLAQTHPDHGSPHRAGQVQTASAIIILLLFLASGMDAYGMLFAWSTALGALCILAVQTAASLAVAAFLWRAPQHTRRGQAVAAALAAAVGLGGCLAALVINLPLIAATRATAIWCLPAVPVVLGLAGYATAHWRGTTRAQIAAIAA